MSITNEQLVELKELAERAGACEFGLITAFAIAANPTTILALIAEIEQLKKEANWLAEKLPVQNRMDCQFAPFSGCYETPRVCLKDCSDRNCNVCWREAARKAIGRSKELAGESDWD